MRGEATGPGVQLDATPITPFLGLILIIIREILGGKNGEKNVYDSWGIRRHDDGQGASKKKGRKGGRTRKGRCSYGKP